MNGRIEIATAQAFQRGKSHNMSVAQGICLDHEMGREGFYMGEIVDSGERKHLWSKFHYDRKAVSETNIVLKVLSFDSLWLALRDGHQDLEQILQSFDRPLKSLISDLEAFKPRRYENTQDILLIDLEGRYLVYWFEMIAEGPSDWITKVEIEYERFSWLNYLPQIYTEESDFLERYLAIFQTVHDHMESVVDQMAQIYRPQQTQALFLDVLSKWLPIDGGAYWNERQKRELLSNYQAYTRIRGSREGIVKYVELFTGKSPFVVEYPSYKYLLESTYHSEVYKRLYGEDPYHFTLILDREALKHAKQFEALHEILSQIVPAQVSYKIALLNPYMVLDDYVYLGVNSYICNQSEIVLDEQSMLSMGVIGGESGEGMTME